MCAAACWEEKAESRGREGEGSRAAAAHRSNGRYAHEIKVMTQTIDLANDISDRYRRNDERLSVGAIANAKMKLAPKSAPGGLVAEPPSPGLSPAVMRRMSSCGARQASGSSAALTAM